MPTEAIPSLPPSFLRVNPAPNATAVAAPPPMVDAYTADQMNTRYTEGYAAGRAEQADENGKLRQYLCNVLTALGNGSGASPQCSLEFLSCVPDEVTAFTSKQAQEIHKLRAALAELVACKELKQSAEGIEFAGPVGTHGDGWRAEFDRLRADYLRRQPEAWKAARALVEPRP